MQGRKSRWRDADDVEALVRANLAQGVYRFFITDDNFARKAEDYSPEHIERMFRRAKASGIKPVRLANHVLQFYFTFRQEKVHPLQGGFFRRKLRRQRRADRTLEHPLIFYPRRLWQIADTHVRLIAFYLLLHRIRRRVERDPLAYHDPALLPVEVEAPAANAAPQPPATVAA